MLDPFEPVFPVPNRLTEGISVVIPAYNEEAGLAPVLERLFDVLSTGTNEFEVIVVDDGSTDGTLAVAETIAERYVYQARKYPEDRMNGSVTLAEPSSPLRVISHGVNKGYGAALKTGVRAARHDLVVMMDSDGQHDPCDVLRLAALAGGCDMVVGARSNGSYAPTLRKPGKWLLRVTANYLAGTKIPDLNSGLRAFHRDLALRFAHILPNGFSFTTTLTLACLKEHYKITWTPITVVKRTGHSTVNPLTDGYNTFILILRTIVLFDPLKVFLPPSLLLGLFGILFSLYGLVRFRPFPIPAWL
jgi:glycosyltransferase involved in cell wall biosynthesis